MAADDDREAKRPRRTYRACWPCRGRKLKCSFGADPNRPWDGPCERCLREQRECLRAKPTFVKDPVPRKSDLGEGVSQQSTPQPTTTRTTVNNAKASTSARPTAPTRTSSNSQSHTGGFNHDVDDGDDPQGSPSSDDEEQRDSGNKLVSSHLQNPSDALRLLASASSLQYRAGPSHATQPKPKDPPRSKQWLGNNAAMWGRWSPIRQGCLTVQDARALFSFFELEMAPLYSLLHPSIFEPQYLETLVKSESLLLGSIIVIAARYSKVLSDNRGAIVHNKLSVWVRQRILGVIDGDPLLRTISSVEAFLLLSEWPMLPVPTFNEHDTTDDDDAPPEEALLLKPSTRYDAYSWAYMGIAVRLAQELGIHDIASLSQTNTENSWKQNRMLKTWIHCYNADRHIAIRLGRNAVLHEAMNSRWWETFSSVTWTDGRTPLTRDLWTSDAFTLGSLAQLLGTIQDHLYPNKDVTRSLLNSGAWESFLRSLRFEIRYSKRACQNKLNDGSVAAALLRIEFDYTVLYAYSLALRALQGKLRRRRLAGDLHYHSPSLMNMVEGPWVMDALVAARSIVEVALSVLEERNILRYCPSRIFQYILFATTFLYKALAAGMVEFGEHNVAGMLEKLVSALRNAAIDDEHFLHGFAILLKRLGKHWRPQDRTSTSIFNRPAAERPENADDCRAKAFLGSEAQMSLASNPALPPMGPTHDSTVGPTTTSLPDLQSFQFDIPGVDWANHSLSGGATSMTFNDPRADDLMWNFDPTFQMPAADHEQDILFQSIWDNTQTDASLGASNLYATLLGDTLSFPEGFEAM